MALHDYRYLGISEVAESTGFSLDTLRWYEREGLFPQVERDSSRRRRYSPREVSLSRTLARLRRTGMPTREMREFTRLVTEGAATHSQRLALLAAHRDRGNRQTAGDQAPGEVRTARPRTPGAPRSGPARRSSGPARTPQVSW
jgi:DNA-binding transcriptional MerR regulator